MSLPGFLTLMVGGLLYSVACQGYCSAQCDIKILTPLLLFHHRIQLSTCHICLTIVPRVQLGEGGCFKSSAEPDMVVYTYNPHTQEAEAGGLGVQG
jgi:hypothetical protein